MGCCDTIGPIARRTNKDPSKKSEKAFVSFSAPVEQIRFVAFIVFWIMCATATAINYMWVIPSLAEGPADGNTCPPFERNDPDLGLVPGKGFDQSTESHLLKAIGFNNICVNWDYSPSREITSMVYPAFEYLLLLYLVMDMFSIWLGRLRGDISDCFWIYARITFPINIFLCTQFRQIFVLIAYLDVQGHSAAFLGLQISLFLVNILNLLLVIDMEIGYDWFDCFGGPAQRRRNTKIAGIIYLVIGGILGIWGMYTTYYAVAHAAPVPWNLEHTFSSSYNNAFVLDKIWVFFNAVLSPAVAYKRAKADHPIQFTVTQRCEYYGDDGEDTTPLR